jgi:hypothetical protein
LIGFSAKDLTSGFEVKLIFYWTPTYISLKVNGIFPSCLSKRSGWLHTFLNCITRFIKFSIFCLFSASWKRSFVEILSLMRWYRTL